MSLEDDFHKCVLADDVTTFESLFNKYETAELLSHIKSKLYSITMHSALKILEKSLKIPTVLAAIKLDRSLRESLLYNAARHDNSVSVLNLLLEHQEFVDDVIQDPLAVIKSATANTFFADILQRVQEITSVTDLIDEHCESLWLQAMYDTYGKSQACKRLLEFPSVFDFVDSEIYPGNPGSRRFLNTQFMEYYFKRLQARIAEFNNTNSNGSMRFDVSGAQESRLCYLILRNLISTYQKREEIRKEIQSMQQDESSKSVKFSYYWAHSLSRQFKAPEINIHLHRIQLLLSMPSVRRKAADNNNELLRMVVGRGELIELEKLLLGVELVQARRKEFPIDAQYEINNPINFKSQYLASHRNSDAARQRRERILRIAVV
jgi:hypothetical protein